MKLHFQKLGRGKPLVILHGLFGSADNWATLGKKIADHSTVYLVDQRNHGRSGHSDDFSYELMADDLLELLQDEGLDKVSIIGHSMGGKTAMRFAQRYPERLDKMMVVDIGVKAYPPHHGTILQGLQSIDLGSLGTRGDAEEQLKAHISDFGTRQFLLKSLYRTDKENFGWRINIPVLDSKMPEILKAIPKESVDVPAMFVSGSKSDYVKAADHAAITKNFPHAQFVELPTGHWVHAEDPEGLEQLIRKFVTT